MAELCEVKSRAYGWVTWWVLIGVASKVLDKTFEVWTMLQEGWRRRPHVVEAVDCLIEGLMIGRNLGSNSKAQPGVFGFRYPSSG